MSFLKAHNSKTIKDHRLNCCVRKIEHIEVFLGFFGVKSETDHTVFCPGLKKDMVLLEEKGYFCSRKYILRELSRTESFSESTLHKLWATHPMFEM